jgi:hypothetical protein
MPLGLLSPPACPAARRTYSSSAPQCDISVLCLTIDTPQGPNWYGIGYPQGIQSFNSVNIFCHPYPATAGMKDSEYQSRSGNWSHLFRYAQNLGFQIAAANSNQILVVPFFSNASYSSGGIFAPNWKEILSVMVQGVSIARGAGTSETSAINAALGVAIQGDCPLDFTVQNVVMSCFSFGRVLMQTLRQRMPGLHGTLQEVWDFDGSGTVAPFTSHSVKALIYDQAVSTSPMGFHVPRPRWSKFAPAKNADIHGFIPNMLMFHAAWTSTVGK